VKSEDSDGLALHLTSIEFPEDGSTVFKVLGHEVSKGAVSIVLYSVYVGIVVENYNPQLKVESICIKEIIKFNEACICQEYR